MFKHEVTANSGEWGELQIMTSVIMDGEVFSTRHARTMPVDYIEREESCGTMRRYTLQGDRILISSDGVNNIIRYIDDLSDSFKSLTRTLHLKLKKGSFSDKDGSNLLTALHLKRPVAAGTSKADFYIRLHDAGAEKSGVSVKSGYGGDPTLLNAAGTTNFMYQITGMPVRDILPGLKARASSIPIKG